MPLLPGDRVDGSLLPGYVADSVRTTGSVSITTVETVIQQVTFTAVASARYRVTAMQSVQSTIANDNMQLRIRGNGGATLSTGGSELASVLPNANQAGKGQHVTLWAFLVGWAGQVTVGCTLVRSTGTGTVTSFGGTGNHNLIMVEVV